MKGTVDICKCHYQAHSTNHKWMSLSKYRAVADRHECVTLFSRGKLFIRSKTPVFTLIGLFNYHQILSTELRSTVS